MLFLGFVTKAFGIKGGVFIKLLNNSSEALSKGAILNIKGQNFTIIDVIGQNKVVFQEIKDRTSAESLKGAEVYIEKSAMPSLSPDEYYLADLKNADILDLSLNTIGKVVGFSSNNAQDLLVINTKDGKEAYLPLIKPFIVNIDLEKKQVLVDAPVELFSL